MIIPESYEKKLAAIIDNHTSVSLIPNQYVCNYLSIEHDLSKFIQQNSTSGANVLVIGSRTLECSTLVKSYNIECIETRQRYQNYFQQQKMTIIDNLKQIETQIKNADVIIVFADFIAEEGYKYQDLYNINKWIKTEQQFYLINYQWEAWSAKSIVINNDGELYNIAQYKKWFDLVRSHMHLGFKTTKLPSINIKKLSYVYQVTPE